MTQQPNRIVLDPFNNDLLEVHPHAHPNQDLSNLYAMHQKAANPEAVPEKSSFRKGFFAHQSNRYIPGFDYEAPKFKDGLLETKTTYMDVFSTPIAFVRDAADGVFLASSCEFEGKTTFAGNKFYNYGWIQLTDSSRSGCYRAMYDRQENALYVLPDGFEMSRLDDHAEAVLFRLNADGQPECAFQATLKNYPSISMYASNILYPWEDDKIYSDVCPLEKDGIIFVPFQAVFAHLFAEVAWNAESKTATAVKDEYSLQVTADRGCAMLNGQVYPMPAPALMIHDRLMVPVRTVEDFFAISAQWDVERKTLRFVKKQPYWEKWGRVENSYTTIPLSSGDIYPAYLQQEARQSIAEILAASDENAASIAFLTDIHYTPCENDHIRLTRTLNTYREIAGSVKLDGIALGGDRIYEACKDMRAKGILHYRNHFEGIPSFPVCGNHDPGVQWDNYVLEGSPAVNRFTKQDMFEGSYAHLKTANAVFNPNDPDNQLYYYWDRPDQKIRYIFLDSSDVPQTLDESGKMVYNPIGYLAFSQKQMDWVANQALNLPEEGWTVLFFVHHIVDPDQAYDYEVAVQKNRHTQAMVLLLDAYREGTDVDKTLYVEHPDFTLRMNYRFSEYHRATVAGVIMGHTHTDYAQYSKTGIPYIHTACAYADDVFCNAEAPRRIDGTKDEILFDIVTVSKTKKTLYLTRVGAGDNREFPYG